MGFSGADGGTFNFGQLFGAEGGIPNIRQLFGADGGIPGFGNILGGNGDMCGCVDEADVCHMGITNAHCGTDGEACDACSDGTSCLNGVCDTSDGGTTGFAGIFSRDGGDFGGMMDSMNNWISSLDEAGCAPGVNLVETGPPDPSNPTVGSGGGYGGFYCFALAP